MLYVPSIRCLDMTLSNGVQNRIKRLLVIGVSH